MLGWDHVALFALPQRRQIDWAPPQPIVEVFSESSRLHFFLKVPLGGADEAHIHLDRLVAADPLKLPLLQHAQHLDLHHRGDLPDLVQEDGALVRQLEPPLALPQRARKRPALMPEQFGLKQRLRKGGTADLDEGAIASRAVVVDRSEEHTSELQSLAYLVCRLLLEKKKERQTS